MRRRTLLLAVPAIVPLAARAQTTLPDKGLRIVVGFVANGGADLMARTIAPALQRRIGRRVTIENRPGNTGQAAGETLKLASASDGSSIAFMPSTTIALRAAVASFPFDPEKDLAAITVAGTFETALAVSPRVGVTTVRTFALWARDGEPDRRRIGVTASDALLQVYARTIGRAIDVPLEAVGYRGALPLATDLETGKLPIGAGGVTSFLEHHHGGRLRMLAVSGDRRLAAAPNVPTANELGLPGMLAEEWYGFFASAAAPPEIIAEWNRQIRAVLAERDVATTLAQYGLRSRARRRSRRPTACAPISRAGARAWRRSNWSR